MSRSLNRVMLIGNAGSDPEVKTTGGGVRVANLSLATNRVWNDRNGQKQEKVEWHRLTFWDKLADVVEQYVKKGDRLFVDGRIEYTDNGETGDAKKYFTNIIVQELIMLGSSGAAATPAAPSSTRRAPTPSPFEADDDDLPF